MIHKETRTTWRCPKHYPKHSDPAKNTYGLLLMNNVPRNVHARNIADLLQNYDATSVIGVTTVNYAHTQRFAEVLMSDIAESVRVGHMLQGCVFMNHEINVNWRVIQIHPSAQTYDTPLASWGTAYHHQHELFPPNPRPVLPFLPRGPSISKIKSTTPKIVIPSEFGKTFTCFQFLPSELRLGIWDMNLDEETRLQSIVQMEWQGKQGLMTRTPIQSSLQINQESRYEALKIYDLRFATPGHESKIRCRLEFDIIYLASVKKATSSNATAYECEKTSLGSLTLCHLLTANQIDLSIIRYLAFNIDLYFGGSSMMKPTISQFRTQMPSLLYIRVVCDDGLELDCNGSAGVAEQPINFALRFWPDLATATQIHIARWRIITEDFLEEKLAHPEWKQPEIDLHYLKRGERFEKQGVVRSDNSSVVSEGSGAIVLNRMAQGSMPQSSHNYITRSQFIVHSLVWSRHLVLICA